MKQLLGVLLLSATRSEDDLSLTNWLEHYDIYSRISSSPLAILDCQVII
jgi:hypothetical protein